MKAILLIGGQGTRLRPLTNETPKPLLPVVNRPLIRYQLEALRRHGIREAVLCLSYKPGAFRRVLGRDHVEGVQLTWMSEHSPLGTGGAVRNAESHINRTTLILNGDLLNDLDIAAFLESHRKSGADVSIALTRVKDPTQYGLVETDGQGRIRRFLEKPSWDDVTCNTINAGAYLFEPPVVRFIPPGIPYSLERGLFPHLLENNYRLNGFVAKGYWIDIGTVDKYLQVHRDVLENRTPFRLRSFSRSRGFLLAPRARLGRETSHEGPGTAVLGEGTMVGPYARFIGSVSVGPGCAVGQGAVLENCVVLGKTRIGEGVRLMNCVVGSLCRVGAQAVIGPGRALGDGSAVGPFSQL